LIGPNGSGKTSLLRCAYRFSRPAQGDVWLAHQNVWKQSAKWCAQRIAVVLQEFPDAFGLRVDEVVAMGRTPHKGLFDGDTLHDQKMIQQTLESVGMQGFEDHAFATLSGGEKQRVILARALAQQPQL
ncbi:histidinol phosphatase, partial [Eggerthia catenaformis]